MFSHAGFRCMNITSEGLQAVAHCRRRDWKDTALAGLQPLVPFIGAGSAPRGSILEMEFMLGAGHAVPTDGMW